MNDRERTALMERVWGREATNRNASLAMYGPSTLAIAPTTAIDVPRLEARWRTAPTDWGNIIATNPVMFGPTWRTCMRIGALPLSVYRYKDTNGRPLKREASDHPAYKLLRTPNEDTERNLMVSVTVLSMLAYKLGAWLKTRDPRTQQVTELWPVEPWTLRVVRGTNTLVSGYLIQPIGGGRLLAVRKNDLVVFRLMLDPRNFALGMSPFESLQKTGDVGSSAIAAAKDFFDSGLIGTRWIDAKGAVLDEESSERLRANMAEARAQRGRWPVMEDGFEIRSDGQDPDPENLLKGFERAADFIYKMLGYPGDDDDAKFYSRIVQPICEGMEQALERQLFTIDYESDPAFPQFGFREVLKGDPLKIAQLHQVRLYSGAESIDEGREEEDREPFAIAGVTDVPLVPLNIDFPGAKFGQIPADVLSNVEGGGPGWTDPNTKDTKDGIGGAEGKGTNPTASTGDQVVPPSRAILVPAPLYAEIVAAGRAERSQPRRVTQRSRSQASYGSARADTLARQTTALSNRLRGVLKAELKELKAAIDPGGSKRAAPNVDLLLAVVRRHDPDVASKLRQFMEQTAESAWGSAQDLVDAAASDVEQAIVDGLGDRADVVRDRFGAERVGRLEDLLTQADVDGATSRETAQRVAQLYDDLSARFVDGIARTELAYAHEQAALAAWSAAGVTSMEFVFGGGPCTTGVCEDAAAASPFQLGASTGDVGYSFADADSPPLHPNCTCFAVAASEGA